MQAALRQSPPDLRPASVGADRSGSLWRAGVRRHRLDRTGSQGILPARFGRFERLVGGHGSPQAASLFSLFIQF